MLRPVKFPAIIICLLLLPPLAAIAEGAGKVREVSSVEKWEIRKGRFYQNGEWVFLKTGKLLSGFGQADTADQVIADLDVMIDRLNYNNFSLNIYPHEFDADGDAQIDEKHKKGYEGVGRIIDHCWKRGIFCCLSFETYNIGGGGVPASLFDKYPDMGAVNALGEPAVDLEYFEGSRKPAPSIYHPGYLNWSRTFIKNFIRDLGKQRTSRLLYVETTVEPQYLGSNNSGDKDQRRAYWDFSEAAHKAFDKWQKTLAKDDPLRTELHWPTNQDERDKLVGDAKFNVFRAQGLGDWVSGDVEAIHSVIPEVYIAVDYNGRFDDEKNFRVGDRPTFLKALKGVDIIQVAPHTPNPWGTFSWDDVIAVNKEANKQWAISEHMTVNGTFGHDDDSMRENLEDTLVHGTGWGWEFVTADNNHENNDFHVYNRDWTSPNLDIVDGDHWPKWLKKIGAKPFVPKAREPSGSVRE